MKNKTIAQILTDNKIEYLEYDFAERQRRRGAISFDTKTAAENLLLLSSVFEKQNIKFWLVFGTLLGAIRDKDFIPHDTDTDIGVFATDKDKLISAIPDLVMLGLVPIRTKRPDDLLSLMRNDEYINIGIYSQTSDALGYKYWGYQCDKVYGNHFDSFDAIKFLGIEFCVPQNAEKLLEVYYGKNWKTPMINCPAKKAQSYRDFEQYSNLLVLTDFFREMPSYAVLKLSEDFPNYHDYSDIDILCNNRADVLNHILEVVKTYEQLGYRIEQTSYDHHTHVDVFPPGATRLNFRFDLLEALDTYKKFIVDHNYHDIVLANRRLINNNDIIISVPSAEHDLAIRFFEYLEYIAERPSKIKHLNYIIKCNDLSFINVVNRYTNLNITFEPKNETLKVSYKSQQVDGLTIQNSCSKAHRMDYFLIWGNGIHHTAEILTMIRENPHFEIITIVKKNVGDIVQFVNDVYSCDSVPLEHLVEKNRYLIKTSPEIIFILTRNNNPQEKYFGDGPFRHIQCQTVKDLKEEIRNRFNPRLDSKRSEEHVIHASDYESQVEHVLQVLGLPSLEYYKRVPHPDIDAPYHLGKIDQYEIIDVSTECLYANILGRGILRIQDTPHYRYVSGKRADYLQYHQKHCGIALTDDHYPEAFDRMINNFSYNSRTASGKQNLIVAKKLWDGKYQILDGVHRASILAYRGIKRVKISVVSRDNRDYLEEQEPLQNQSEFIHDSAQMFEKNYSQSWLQNNFQEIYGIIRRSVDMFMHSGTLSIGRQQTLTEFFQGNEGLWQKFISQIIDKNCLEIGSGPCGIANYWHFIRNWHVIDPLVADYKQMTLEMFGKTWWWDRLKLHPQNAELLLPDLIGRIDGVIVCRNCLDHTDDPIQVMNNMARYAAPGCKLLLWTDLYHTQGHDGGHRNICKTKDLFRTMITSNGFSIDYETPPFRQGETIEFGCVATKLSGGLLCQVIVFSKDRPLQLDAALRSFMLHCLDSHRVSIQIIVMASNEHYGKAYQILEKEYSSYENIIFVSEIHFRQQVLDCLHSDKYVLWLVDDNIFIRDFDLASCCHCLDLHQDALGYSLRLGESTTYCYPLDKSQPLPICVQLTPDIMKYDWTSAKYDFGYPLEVSSSLYRTTDMLQLLTSLQFHNPNSLEAEMVNQVARFQKSHPYLLCSKHSLTFCNPINKVQNTVCANRAGKSTELTAESLLACYLKGQRIDVAAFNGFTPNACHQEVSFTFVKKDGSSPKVSVVIPCYNQAHFLTEAVESVVEQTFTDWECLIVNDGSPDNTSEVSRKLIERYPGKRIKLLEKPNGGLADARNYGIAWAQGKYILPLDSDDMIHPDMLSKTVHFLDNNPSIAIVYTDLMHFGAVKKHVVAGEYNFRALRYGNQLNCCSLYRREAWKAVGGYNTNMTWGYEDWDFWIGCGERGYFACHLPEALLFYRVKDESMYTKALEHDPELKAQIIINHPWLYSEEERARAHNILGLSRNTSAVPMVSVIVPTYNRRRMLPDTIRSILDQTFKDFEIIVVNDAGEDVADIINELNQLGKIRYISHETNKGLAAARNSGIRAARGKYIAYLDDDDLFYPSHLKTLVSFLELGEYQVAYTDAYRAHQGKINDEYIVTKRDVPYSFDFDYDRILTTNFIPVLCVIHNRSCVEQTGLFDESLENHEDWDMWIRMSRIFKFAHIKELTCEFAWRTDGTTMTSAQVHDYAKTRQSIIAKYNAAMPSSFHISKFSEKVVPAHSIAMSNIHEGDDDYHAAVAMTQAGNHNEAIEAFKALVSVYPEHALAHNDLGVLSFTRGDKDAALAHYRLAVKHEPRNATYLKNLADLLYVAFGNVMEALPIYIDLATRTPEDIEVLLALGHVSLTMGKYENAASFYRKVLALVPGNDQAAQGLAALEGTDAAKTQTFPGVSADAGYQSKLRREIATYSANTNVHDLPKIHDYYANEFLSPSLRSLTGHGGHVDWWVAEINRRAAATDSPVSVLSIGCGNGDMEIEILKRVVDSQSVVLHGLDINGAMIDRARAAAASHGFATAIFSIQDMNFIALKQDYDIVIANHSLHHIVELERLFAEIRDHAAPGMRFFINDMIGRNGHRMWDNATPVVEAIWPRLDEKHRFNHHSRRFDARPLNADFSSVGFEGIRAQDILPLLISYFDIDLFLPFATIINRFVDRAYGHNFSPENARDVNLIMNILALDVKLLSEKKLSPTQAYISARPKGSARYLRYFYQTPAEAIAARNYPITEADCRWDVDSVTEQRIHQPYGMKPLEGPMVICSIIIPVFNKVEYTKRCIGIVQKITPSRMYEIIIIDNASSDGTADYLCGLTQSVRVITNEENVGFTKACNQGARSARGEFVLFLNNDTEPQLGWLEALVEAARSDPKAGIIGSKLVYPDGRLQEAGGIVFSDGSGWNYGRFDDPEKPKYNYVREVDYVSGASLMVRRSLLETIGYFDEQYSPGYYEDTDLCFAARAAGYKVIYTPFSVVVHHEGVSSGTDLSKSMKQYQVLNRSKFVEKWQEALQKQYSPSNDNVEKASERNVIGNILVIDPFLPMFDRASGSLRLFTVVTLLRGKGYHLTYIARDGGGQERYVEILRKIGVEVHATDQYIIPTKRYDIPDPSIDLEVILADRLFDIAYLSFYDIARQYLAQIRLLSPSTKIIIDTVDIHFVRERRQAELANDPVALSRAVRTKMRELSIYSKADLIITVTEQDWNNVSESLLDKPHSVIPNIHTVYNEAVNIEGRSGIIFVGNFSHLPNIDSIIYFVNQIFPIVRKTLPEMIFTVVGNNPPKEILELKSKNIIVTGYVPSTAPYLENARVSVAPLRYGAGMKGKIGEAMALGLPVVTTSIGAEGMGLVHEKTAFITDDPKEFAAHIIRLCAEDDLWRAVSEKGRQFIKEHFSPEQVAILLDRMITVLENISPLKLTAEEKALMALSGRILRKDVVSIVILTFNELKYTRECIESIRKHTPEPHEIIFVDNASTDGTLKWLRKISQENPNYKLIENKKNLGFAKGCNQGIEASSGEYVLLLNNDVVVNENWLSGMLECLNSASDTGIVGPMTNNISGPQKVLDGDYKTKNRMIEYAKSFRERYRHRRVSSRRIVGFCMLFRRTLADKIGLLDESFGTGNFEDDDYCLRAALAGCRNLIAGDVFIHHYGSRSFIGNRIDYGSSMSGNIKIFDEKWMGIDVDTPLGKKVTAFNFIQKADALNQKGQPEKAIAMFIEGIKYAPEEKAVYYRLAEMLLDAKLYKDALEAVQSMPREAGDDLKRLEIIAYCTEGPEEAGKLADRILTVDADYAAAINLKGISAYKQGDNSAAEDFFGKAIASDPGYGEPYTNLGIMKWAADQKEEALDCLEKGFILSPTLTDNVTLYHSAITALERFERAEKLFLDAKELHPENKRILFFLIDIFIKQGKFDAAMHEIEQAMLDIGIDDGMLSAALEIRERVGIKKIDKAAKNRGALSLCMIVKNEEQHLTRCLLSAKPVVDEMIVVDTGSTDRTKGIAKAFGAKVFDFPWTNDFSEARNYSLSRASGDWILVLDADEVISPLDYASIEKIMKKRPAKPVAYNLVTRNYTNEVNSKGWVANDRKYRREEAGTGWFPSAKVRLFVNDKRIQFQNPVHEFVEASIEKAGIEIKTSNIPVHHYGRFDRDKLIAKGRDYFLLGKKKIEEMKGDIKALKELAIQASELGEYATAVELWKKAIELDLNDSVAFLNISYAYMKLEQYQEAHTSSRRAMELDPAMKEAALNYAGSEFIIGDIKRTISVLESLLRKEADYPPAVALVAAAYCIDGQKEQGFDLFEKLRKKSFGCADMLDEQTRGLMSQGRFDQAVSLLEVAIKTGNINKDTHTLLAECQSKK